MTRTRSGSSSTSGRPIGARPMIAPPTTSTIGYGTLIARAAADSTATATSSATRMISTSSTTRAAKCTTPPLSLSTTSPALEQQVDVAEHLAQRQVRLRDGDVAPDRLRDLVRGARLLGDQARASCSRAARASRSARRSAPRGRRTRSPWPGSTVVDRHRAGLAQRLQVHDQRARAAAAGLARPAAERLRDQRVRGDVLDQVVAGEQQRRRRRRRTRCPTASARAGAAPASVRFANSSSPPSVQRVRDRRAAAPAAVARATSRPSAVTTSRAIPWRSISACAELVVAVGVDVEVLDHRRQQVERADLGARALGEDARPARGGRCAGG